MVNTLGAMAEFLAVFESADKPIRVVLESTTNSRAMHGLLHRYAKEAKVNLSAQVLDARKLRVIAESVAKCDKLDAVALQMLEEVWTMLRKDLVYQDANEVKRLHDVKDLHEVKSEVVPGEMNVSVEMNISRAAIHSAKAGVIAPDVAG